MLLKHVSTKHNIETVTSKVLNKVKYNYFISMLLLQTEPTTVNVKNDSAVKGWVMALDGNTY